MQRLFSLMMLGLLLASGWMFLEDEAPTGGGNWQLPQIGLPAPQNSPQQPRVATGQQPPGGLPYVPPNYGQSGPIIGNQPAPAASVPQTYPPSLPSQGTIPGPGQSASLPAQGGNRNGSFQPPAIYASQRQSGPAFPSQAAARDSIRVASFNIQTFGDSKASVPQVMQVLASIVAHFDIVAIQEIRTQDDYLMHRFVEWINRDGRTYDFVIGPRLGRSRSTEQYAYVYNTATVELNRHHVYTVRDPDDLLHREPHVAMFRTRGVPAEEAFTFILVNVHVDPDLVGTEVSDISQVYRAVRGASGGEDDIILLGDFNVNERRLSELGQVPGIVPIIRGMFTNTRKSATYDNIVIHQPSTTEFTSRWGVYDIQQIHGLTLDQALYVSDHLPVWAEFSVREGTGPRHVAFRP